MHGIFGRGLGLSCLLTSGLSLLVGGGGLGVHVLNTGLGAGVDVFDRFGILGGQVVELIGLVDDGRGLLTNIVFAGAADRRQKACCQSDD